MFHWVTRKRKWSSLTFILGMYLSGFALIVTYQFVSKVFLRVQCVESSGRSRVNHIHSHQRLERHLAPKQETNETTELQQTTQFSFKFSRQELRLQFKDVESVPRDARYDNAKKIHCVQNYYARSNQNTTDDLWCQSRARFIQDYKNPCYYSTEIKGFYEDTVCLPYFHILGADKCGTTDFHARLVEHPEILKNAGNLGKETYYWCWLRYGLWMLGGIGRWKLYQYIKYFFLLNSQQIVTGFVETGAQLITGDGTPMDLWDFRGWQRDPQNAGLDEPRVLTPHLMRHVYPDPCFFVLMRNPVERLYSDYLSLGYNRNLTSVDFARDVITSVAAMRDCLQVNSTRKCFFSDDMYHKMPVRLHVGGYSVFLREWLSVFHRRNFFFLRTEDWHKNTTRELERAFDFLEVAPLPKGKLMRIASTDVNNVTHKKKTAGRMLPETRKALTEFYAPFNEDLAKLLGDDRYLWKGGTMARDTMNADVGGLSDTTDIPWKTEQIQE